MKMVSPSDTIVAYARWWVDGQKDLEDLEPVQYDKSVLNSEQIAASKLVHSAEDLNIVLKRAHIEEEKFLCEPL